MPGPFWIFLLFFSTFPFLFAAASTDVTVGIAASAVMQTDSVKSRTADLINFFS
jgi:hypothetical protein